MIVCIMAWSLYLFVCTLHYPIIIIMETYLKALNMQNACQVYSVKCVFKIKSIIFHTIYRDAYFLPTHFSFDECGNIWTASYYHDQIRNISQCLE